MKNRVLTLLTVGAATLALSSHAMAEDHGGKMHKGAKMFEKHDTNGDGVISKAEFLTHAEERFSKMDVDGDGNVTKDEAKAAKEKMREKWKEMKDKRGGKDKPADGGEAE